jgi:predicted RNase H-like HicB family nuclease
MKKKMPYMIRTFWSEEDGCYIAEVPELKGCSGLGSSPELATKEAIKSIDGWLQVAKKEGLAIPPPMGAKHSKRLNLRLPEEVIDQLKRAAKERNMSINQYLLWRLAI